MIDESPTIETFKDLRHESKVYSKYFEEMPYAIYLKSAHWGYVRRLKIAEAEGKCATCSSTLLLHVHHRQYPVKRVDIKPDMLIVLCKICHGKLHG